MKRLTLLFLASGVMTTTAALAAEDLYSVTIREHQFFPAEIKVPAGKKVKLTVENLDPTPEEFESKTLKIEKVIPGGKTMKIRIPSLKQGTYPFVGEFHEATAKGKIIAE